MQQAAASGNIRLPDFFWTLPPKAPPRPCIPAWTAIGKSRWFRRSRAGPSFFTVIHLITNAPGGSSDIVSELEESLDLEQAVMPETIDQRTPEQRDIFCDYLDFGMFSEHVVVFRRAFAKDRRLVLLFEDNHADFQQTCRRIYRFLGVDADVVVDNRHEHNRLTEEPKVNWLVA